MKFKYVTNLILISIVFLLVIKSVSAQNINGSEHSNLEVDNIQKANILKTEINQELESLSLSLSESEITYLVNIVNEGAINKKILQISETQSFYLNSYNPEIDELIGEDIYFSLASIIDPLYRVLVDINSNMEEKIPEDEFLDAYYRSLRIEKIMYLVSENNQSEVIMQDLIKQRDSILSLLYGHSYETPIINNGVSNETLRFRSIELNRR